MKNYTMGKLIFGINITVDGCCDHTKGGAYKDAHDYFTQLMRETEVLLYGRKTYELMVPFWPDMANNPADPAATMIDFANAFVAVNKIVVCSRTLAKPNDKTTIIGNHLKEEVLKLKQETTGNIVTGGVDIPAQLIQLGLVDEYRIMIQPLIAGAGRRLADNIQLAESLQLTLADATTLKSGCVALRYVKQ